MLAVPSLLVDMKARGGALGGFVGRGFEAASAYSRSVALLLLALLLSVLSICVTRWLTCVLRGVQHRPAGCSGAAASRV